VRISDREHEPCAREPGRTEDEREISNGATHAGEG
jgi:hypothetical protein